MSLSLLRPAARALRTSSTHAAAVRRLQTSSSSSSSPFPWRTAASLSLAAAAGIGITTVLCETATPAADPAKDSTTPAAAAAGNETDDYDPLRDTEIRYAGYSARIGNILAQVSRTLAGKVRYLGYTSDIGESARPILDVKYVNLLYGVTFAYVFGDVIYQGYRANEDGYDKMEVARTMTQTATFQGVVSVVMPSLIIHQGVHWSKKLFEAAPGRVKVFGPVIVGLCIIPFLPYLDHPAENLINTAFCKVWPSKYPERNHGHKTHHEHSAAHPTNAPATTSDANNTTPTTTTTTVTATANTTASPATPAAPTVTVSAPVTTTDSKKDN